VCLSVIICHSHPVAKSDLSLQLTFLTALLSLEEEQDEEMLHQIDIQVLQYI